MQQQHDPASLVKEYEYLTSGIGVAINVVCRPSNVCVIGQRMNVNFRRGEFDIGAVEGIRPTANVNSQTGALDIESVVRRALDEELGLKNSPLVLKRPASTIVKSIKVLGFFLDLKYYQYNFCCHCDVDASLDEIQQMWAHANDKRENKYISGIEFRESSIFDFISTNDIWSSGVVCLLKSLAFSDAD